MSQGNGFSYSPHFKTSSTKRGPPSSYQELSNGYNKLYQPQAYAAMNGAPNMPHYPFQPTFVAYPANMMTANDEENGIGRTVPQDSSNGFTFPVVTAQTHCGPTPDGSSMPQIVKINHQNSDTTFTGGPQAQMMVAYPSGYIRNTNDFSNNETTHTREEALFPSVKNHPGAASCMNALSGNSQPRQTTSGLEVHTHTQAIRRPDLTANTQIAHVHNRSRGNGDSSSRSLTSSLEEKATRGDEDKSRLTGIAGSKSRARSALSEGSGYHKQIPSSDGRQRILNRVPSQNEASQVMSPPTPINQETRSSVRNQPSFQDSTYLGGNGMVGSQKPHTPPQASSASDYKSRIELPEPLKSQRRRLPESALSSNFPMRNMQLDHIWGESTVISSPNSQNLHRNLKRGGGHEKEALSANLTSLLGDRYSDSTVTPSKLDPDSNLVTGKLKKHIQRAAGQVEAVKDADATWAEESAKGVEIGMEIKETIERMLQYKNMNPILFSKIWVQVKKDQGGQEIEIAGKCNALLNGDRNQNSPIPSQNHLGSRSELSVEPLKHGNMDIGRENSQLRKRKSSEIVSGASDPRRQRPGVVHLTPTPTIPRLFAESIKSTHAERSIVVNGSLSPPGNSTSIRILGVQTPTPEVTRVVRPGLVQGAPPPVGTPSTWSKEKKKVLAQALRNKLASISGNASSAITTDEIIRTFNNTPSMAEVRRSLKDRGLNISAEDLYQWWCATLRKYDEGTINEQQSSKLEGPPLHYSGKAAAPGNLNYSMNGHAHNSSLSPATPSVSNRHHHLKEIQKPLKLHSPPPIDSNTRKRSYASVVDLTSERSPSIIDGIQTSKVEMEMADDLNLRCEKISPLSHTDTATASRLLDQTANKRMKKSLADDKGKDLSHFEYAKSQQDLLHSNIIITPMDVRKALRRSTYDSDSIAKDVLIAAAKHPTEAPLNNHVDALRNKFIYVSSRSDLSTFRWELVDPGPDEQNIPAARSRIADVDDTEGEGLDLLDLRKSTSAARHQKEVIAANDRVVRAPNADATATQTARGRPTRQEKVMSQRFTATNIQEVPSNTVVPVPYSDRAKTTDKISKSNRQSGQQAPNGSDALSLARKPKDAAGANPESQKRPRALPQGAVRFKPSFARPRDVVARSGSRIREASPIRLEQRIKARLPVSTQNSKPPRSSSLTSRKSYSTMRPSGLRNFVTPSDGIAVVIQSPPPKTGTVERIPRR